MQSIYHPSEREKLEIELQCLRFIVVVVVTIVVVVAKTSAKKCKLRALT